MSVIDERKTAKAGKYLTFMIENQTYGIQIETVSEINRLTSIASIPQVPSYVSGVMNLRGKVVPVVDLSMRFGFPAAVASKETCVIVIEARSGHVGAIVDRVSDVTDFDSANIEPAPDLGDGGGLSFVIGLGKSDGKIVILVDVTEILAAKSFISLQHFEVNSKNEAA